MQESQVSNDSQPKNDSTQESDNETDTTKIQNDEQPRDQTTDGNNENVSTTTPSIIVRPSCRICSRSDAKLITPCNCRGIFAYAHEKCLDEWLEFTQSTECDICQFKYIVEKRKKSVLNWLLDEGKLFKYFDDARKYSFTLYTCLIAAQCVTIASKI